MSKSGRWGIICILAAGWVLLQGAGICGAKDPAYPVKPVEFYIGMSAGGTTDLAGRALIAAASKHLEQPIVPVNKPGGGGTIAAMSVISAKPDGYTIGVLSAAQSIAAPLSGIAPYKDISGFTWINKFGSYIFPLLVRGDAPWKDFKEFIAWARKNPRGVKIGTTAAKTVDIKGFILWQVEKKEQVEFTYVPFKGSGDVLSAILGGHINLYGSTVDASTMSYLEEKKLRLLAYLGPKKVRGFEQIPSVYEMYGFELPDYIAVYGPKGLPPRVVSKLEGAFAKAVKDPEFIKVMDRMYMPIAYTDGAGCKKYVEEWYGKIGKIYEKMRAEEPPEKK